MLTTATLIDAAKKAQGLPSNGRLALVLGVPDKTVQRWNTGKNQPDDAHAIRLASLAGLDPAEVLAALAWERSTGETRRVWETVAKRAAQHVRQAGAAVLAVILSLWIGGGPDGSAMAATPGVQAKAAPVDSAGSGNAHCRGSWFSRIIQRISRLLPPLIAEPQPA